MEQKKYHLQKEILKALKANDSDLYSLLKSQWAHRFGVESLEELKNLDLAQLNQNSNNLNNQSIDLSKGKSLEVDKAINVKVDNDQEKEIKTKEFESTKDENDESFEIKSYEIVQKENVGYKSIKPVIDNKIQTEIEALIPLPPKPKYSFLRKWLVRM